MRKLSKRERKVVVMIARGLTNREIGDRLGIKEGTVKIHVHHVLTKTGMKNRMQIMRSYLTA